MLTGIFATIELILRLLGLWGQFQNWYDSKKLAEAQKNTQDRDDAVDRQKAAQSEDDFDKAQSDITDHLPRP